MMLKVSEASNIASCSVIWTCTYYIDRRRVPRGSLHSTRSAHQDALGLRRKARRYERTSLGLLHHGFTGMVDNSRSREGMEAEQSPGCTLALDLARHAACWVTTDSGYSDLLRVHCICRVRLHSLLRYCSDMRCYCGARRYWRVKGMNTASKATPKGIKIQPRLSISSSKVQYLRTNSRFCMCIPICS